MPLLLLSKLQPLRWVAIWFRVLHWKRQHLYRFDVTAQKFPPPFRFRLAAKTALWWEFLRFRPGFASLDSGPRKTGIRVMARIFFVNTRQLVASVISLATSFYASHQKLVSRSFCCSSLPNRTRYAGLRFGFGYRPESLCLKSVRSFQLIASVISLATSFLCFALKTHLALILLLLASEPNPLRWASVRFWVQT